MIDSARAVLNRLHHLLAGWRFAVWAALKVRNQCAAVIAYRLAPSPDPEANGERWLARNAGRGAGTFVDVGAHRGRWTSLLLEHAAGDAKGLLFEPNLDLVPELRSRFAHHGEVEICGFALGAATGELPFRVDRDNGERSRIIAGPGAPGDRRSHVSTLDQEIATRRWAGVDIVKIDAEGHDLQVLRGATALLAQRRIGLVQFEYGEGWPSSSSTLRAALDFLSVHGYQTYLLRPDGLEDVSYERWGEHFSYSNYVAVSPQLQGQIERWLRP